MMQLMIDWFKDIFMMDGCDNVNFNRRTQVKFYELHKLWWMSSIMCFEIDGWKESFMMDVSYDRWMGLHKLQ